jgi:hypothetical protein
MAEKSEPTFKIEIEFGRASDPIHNPGETVEMGFYVFRRMWKDVMKAAEKYRYAIEDWTILHMCISPFEAFKDLEITDAVKKKTIERSRELTTWNAMSGERLDTALEEEDG